MHELVMAQQIVRTVLAEMERRGASEARTIDVELGQLDGLREEDLVRAFRLEATGTPLELTRLNVTLLPAVAFCPRCNETKRFECAASPTHDVPRAACPDCGTELEVQGRRGLVVRSASMGLEDLRRRHTAAPQSRT